MPRAEHVNYRLFL